MARFGGYSFYLWIKSKFMAEPNCLMRIFSCLSVGEFKKRKDGFTKYNGSMTAVLILVLLASTAISMIISEWLTKDHISDTPVQQFQTEVLLLLFIAPGVITIIKAFCQRDNGYNVRHGDIIAEGFHETIETLGLYTFAMASITFDLLGFASEILCHRMDTDKIGHIHSADTVCDLIFYLVKPLFTIAQCMFLKKFARSRFSNESHQQIMLISIIGANICMWFYTFINDEGKEIFDDPLELPISVNQSEQACNGTNYNEWQTVQQIRPYFSPFTLEFTLLASEKLLKIWYRLTNLEWAENALDGGGDYNVEQLRYLEHKAKKLYEHYSHEFNNSTRRQHRMRFWIEEIVSEIENLKREAAAVQPPAEAENNQIQQLRELKRDVMEHLKNITTVVTNADSNANASTELLKKSRETIHMIEFRDAVQPGGRDDRLVAETDRDIAQLRGDVNRQKRTAENTKPLDDAIVTAKRSHLRFQEAVGQERGDKCGRSCSFGLLLGAVYIAVGLTLIILHGLDEDSSTYRYGRRNTTFTINSTFKYALYGFQGVEIFIQCILTLLIVYGFYMLSFLPSNHSGFTVLDAIYAFITSGYFMFAVFSIISDLYTIENTVKVTWRPYQFNKTAYIAIRNDVHSGDLDLLSTVCVSAKFVKLLSTFLASSFVLYASQCLPHGDPKKNSTICEIIQLLTVLYFIFWIVDSFLIISNPSAFYLLGKYYLGHSFKVITQVTLPITIYYYFATAVRGFDINNRFTQLP